MAIELPFPELRQPLPRRWRLIAATATSRYDCTPGGIALRCHGACCRSPAFWPPRTGVDAVCPRLGPEGCTLGDARPVTCHLYPLRINPQGTLVLHGNTRFPQGMCKGNRGQGPMLIDALRPGLVVVLGEDEYEAVRATVLCGRNALVVPLPWVAAALAQEAEWEAANVPPVPREDP